jgi:hypothetical protein
MTKAVRLTEENVVHILLGVRAAARLVQANYNVEQLKDEMEYNAGFGRQTYLVVDGEFITDDWTCTCFNDVDFHNIWEFTHGEIENSFAEVTRKKEESDTEVKANLGAATTRELLEEIAVRMELTQNSTGGRILARQCREAMSNLAERVLTYRTIDS